MSRVFRHEASGRFVPNDFFVSRSLVLSLFGAVWLIISQEFLQENTTLVRDLLQIFELMPVYVILIIKPDDVRIGLLLTDFAGFLLRFGRLHKIYQF